MNSSNIWCRTRNPTRTARESGAVTLYWSFGFSFIRLAFYFLGGERIGHGCATVPIRFRFHGGFDRMRQMKKNLR